MNYNVKVKTRLTVTDPRTLFCNKFNCQSIRKGASKVFSYSVANISKVNQLTFAFKYDFIDEYNPKHINVDSIKFYNMFDYFIPTEDTKVMSGKDYFIKESDRFIKQDYQEGSSFPVGVTVYEATNEITSDYQYDDHFSYNDTYGEVLFRLSAEETKLFVASCIEDEEDRAKFEIDIVWNTKEEQSALYKDTYEVIPQAPIIVLDSLYSNFMGSSSETTGSLLVSDSLLCSDNIICRN